MLFAGLHRCNISGQPNVALKERCKTGPHQKRPCLASCRPGETVRGDVCVNVSANSPAYRQLEVLVCFKDAIRVLGTCWAEFRVFQIIVYRTIVFSPADAGLCESLNVLLGCHKHQVTNDHACKSVLVVTHGHVKWILKVKVESHLLPQCLIFL